MTRINAGIDPSELSTRHLIAEWREIPMVPAALRRSLRTKSPSQVLSSIPQSFTLNQGHVCFFYDKLAYLKARMMMVGHEMLTRGYTPDIDRLKCFDGFDDTWNQTWKETATARKLVAERINLRMTEKPHLYDGLRIKT